MSKKHSYEFVYNYFKEKNCELLETEYINTRIKIKYRCICKTVSYIRFDHFKAGHRCKECRKKTLYIKQAFTYQYVYNYFKEHGCELLEKEYINTKTKMKYKCECGLEAYIKYDKFRKGQRCYNCRNKKLSEINSQYTGDKTSGWNPNREEVSIKRKIRKNIRHNWVIKNMKDDPLYDEFILDRSRFNIDHIIPLSIFSKIIVEYNLNPDELHKIINKRDNLQILTKSENTLKRDKGCLFKACQYLILNGIKLT